MGDNTSFRYVARDGVMVDTRNFQSETKLTSAADESGEWQKTLYSLQHQLDIYVPPVLILFGFSGNMMSIVILRSQHFRHCPCSVLLCFLAVVDTGVLLTGLLRIWILAAFDIDIRTLCTACCRTHYFVTYLLQHLSSWTVVMVTIHRIVSVFQPFRAKDLCGHRRLAIWMTVLVTCLIAVNAHTLFTLNIHSQVYFDVENGNLVHGAECVFVANGNYFGFYVWPWIDYAIISLLPLMILVVGNTLIVTRVISNRRKRSNAVLFVQPANGRRSKVASMTWMLVAVTITFFITTTPIEIYLIGFDNWNISAPAGYANTLTSFVVCSLWFYVNNASNFLLYCVSGGRFRKALVSFYKRHMLKARRAERRRWARIRLSSGPRVASWL